MTAKNIYIAMYRALDCLYDEDPTEELGEFLSEANPYLFQDRHAADPAIQKEFDEFVSGDLNMADAYECVKDIWHRIPNFMIRFRTSPWKNGQTYATSLIRRSSESCNGFDPEMI